MKTPGESGRYVVEIKLWDTEDIKSTPSNEWWMKVHKKTKYLLSSSTDPLFTSTNDLLKEGFDRIEKIKGITSGTYSSNNRFKPY